MGISENDKLMLVKMNKEARGKMLATQALFLMFILRD
jgi:hypothetical protein